MVKIRSSEISPKSIYVARRRFMTGIGAAIGTGVLGAACAALPTADPGATDLPEPSPSPEPTERLTPVPTSEAYQLDEPLTDYEAVTGYVNFYEFTTSKEGVARLAENFEVSPWTVEVGGLVGSPTVFDLDDLRAFGTEERVYRMRCVEGWSMVIPWLGFPLAKLLEVVEPASNARYVRFETLFDPEQMPGQTRQIFPWPYVEGLSLPEAMHDLTILSTGLYGEPLPKQNGAPIRLVVPWKYGFKSIKSIVKIDLVEEMPVSLWMDSSPSEYGFWANVNPEVPHPRWSQATERRVGEGGRRETLLFNGYAEEVAHLYPDLDDRNWYY